MFYSNDLSDNAFFALVFYVARLGFHTVTFVIYVLSRLNCDPRLDISVFSDKGVFVALV